MYEGTPDYPDKDRLWSIVEKYERDDPLHRAHRDPDVHEVGRPSSRRGTTSRRCGCSARSASRSTPKRGSGTGKHIGGERCPVVDTWWQTETGAIMISPLPGATDAEARERDVPAARHRRRHRRRRRRAGRRSRAAATSCSTRPWPSMLRGIWGDPERYRDTYWSRFDGKYFAGDGAKRDDDGYFWLLGRVDDIMLVSGHNISTTEVESRARRPSRGRRGRGRRQDRRRRPVRRSPRS